MSLENLFSVGGKVALVTGGSRGIGAMIARGFVESGARTYITARKEEELRATAAALSKFGECIAIPSDLSTLAGIKAFAQTLNELEPELHILVNNAGATWGEEIERFPEDGWDKVMDLNVKSPFFLIQQLLTSLKNAGSADDPARIINISSIHAFTNPKTTAYSYSASKAAVVQLTRHLATDLVKSNINVNGIAPGLFPSKMTAYAIEKQADALTAHIPRGRMGNAEDAAGTAIYLCSRASAWVTGHTVALDGGVIANAG